MTTTMDDKDMNEFNQIRERFFADTRQHFFAGNTDNETNDGSPRQNGNAGYSGSDTSHCRQSGT